jgi:hypothetical protein
MNRLLTRLFVFITIVLSSCASSNKIQNTNDISQNTSICDKTIKYTIEKVKMIEGGNEIKVHAEITIDPFSKNINLYADDPESGKKTFDTQIESIDCTFNENLTKGQATYKGYIKQKDGTKTWTTLTIEFKDDQLIINGTNEDRPSNVYMIVDRWEIVTN